EPALSASKVCNAKDSKASRLPARLCAGSKRENQMFFRPNFGTAAVLGLSLAFMACSAGTDERVGSSQEAVETCTFQAPVITEVRAETPGRVTPAVRKVY